jgi:hypothetical protein
MDEMRRKEVGTVAAAPRPLGGRARLPAFIPREKAARRKRQNRLNEKKSLQRSTSRCMPVKYAKLLSQPCDLQPRQ